MYLSAQLKRPQYNTIPSMVLCDWSALKNQLLQQWNNLTAVELDKAGPDRHQIALLVERKYGIHYRMVENYLRNFERTLPLAA